MEVRALGHADAATIRGILASIDRSEHVDVHYAVSDGQLVTRPATMADVPTWADGDGPHSVGALTKFCAGAVERGGIVLAAYEGPAVAGIVIVVPDFEPQLAWFALLHVGRPYRRRGVASALHGAAASIATAAGATSMCVSATETGSAVGFYLSRGYQLARPPHPQLFELEPDDIHLVLDLTAPPQQGANQ